MPKSKKTGVECLKRRTGMCLQEGERSGRKASCSLRPSQVAPIPMLSSDKQTGTQEQTLPVAAFLHPLVIDGGTIPGMVPLLIFAPNENRGNLHCTDFTMVI